MGRHAALVAHLLALTVCAGSTVAATKEPAAEPLITVAFVEGPAVADSGDLYFSDLLNNRIWIRAADGTSKVYRGSSNYANGLAFDAKGRLLAAENGDPERGTPARITRTNIETGRVDVLVSSFEGRGFNGPNDLVADDHGHVFFTDWARPDFLPRGFEGPRNPFGLYRIDPDGTVHRLLAAPTIQAPNGVMVSPDDRTLYLVESNRAAGGARRIMAYPLASNGSLGPGRIFHDFSPGRSGDGLAVDQGGNLWVAAGLNAPRPGAETLDTQPGVHVFAPDGRRLRMLPIPEDLVTNIAFGGPNRRTVYVTAGKTVFTTLSSVPGTRR